MQQREKEELTILIVFGTIMTPLALYAGTLLNSAPPVVQTAVTLGICAMVWRMN